MATHSVLTRLTWCTWGLFKHDSHSRLFHLVRNLLDPYLSFGYLPTVRAGKGGKNRRRGKNENEETKRELEFKEAGQEYAQVCAVISATADPPPPPKNELTKGRKEWIKDALSFCLDFCFLPVCFFRTVFTAEEEAHALAFFMPACCPVLSMGRFRRWRHVVFGCVGASAWGGGRPSSKTPSL